jgi:hypothetical protein
MMKKFKDAAREPDLSMPFMFLWLDAVSDDMLV